MPGSTVGVISAGALRCRAHFNGSRARICHWKRGARCLWGMVPHLARETTLGHLDSTALVVGGNRDHQRSGPPGLVIEQGRLPSRRDDGPLAPTPGTPSSYATLAETSSTEPS